MQGRQAIDRSHGGPGLGLTIVRNLVERHGDTVSAHSGGPGIRAAAEFRPGLAFLDIGLPVMDGFELAMRLRELPGLEGVRLIAVTGYGQEADRRKARAAGFHHHLVKPVDLDAVQAVIRREEALAAGAPVEPAGGE